MVIIINGPCGVGKSTTSEILSGMLDRCVYINCDEVHNMVIGAPIDSLHIGLTDKNISSLVRNFAESGYDNIIIDNVYETESHLKRVLDDLKKNEIEIYVFRLTCDLFENIKRDGQRCEEDVCGENRVIELYKIFEDAGESVGHVIDVTFKSAREVALEIITCVKNSLINFKASIHTQ